VVLVGLALVASALTIQAQVFSGPQNLSNNPGDSGAHQFAVDSGGNIYIVWQDNSPGYEAVFFSRSTDGGATFSTPIHTDITFGAYQPQIAVDASGNINVVWRDGPPESGDIFFTRSTDGGSNFSEPFFNVSNDQGGSDFPYMTLDSSGNIYIVWVKSSTPPSGPRYSDVFFSLSRDGGATFSAPKDLTNNLTSRHSITSPPQIAVDSAGNINLFWHSRNPGGDNHGYFSRSSDGGATFSVRKEIDFSNEGHPYFRIALDSIGNINAVVEDGTFRMGINLLRSNDGGATFSETVISQSGSFSGVLNPQIAIDSSDNINIVWEELASGGSFPYNIFLRRSTDGGLTFSPRQNVSNDPGGSRGAGSPQIAVDAGGNINVVWTDNTPGNNEIFLSRSSDGGATFSTPQNLSNDPGDSNTSQIAVDSNGNINVVWLDNTPGNFDIFFSRGVTSSSLTLSSLTLSPSNVTGGNPSTGTVTLNGPAPSGGAILSLSSSNTAVAGVPPSVTVPAGSSSATFTVTTSAVAASTSVTISASDGTVTQTASLTVTPPALSSLTLNPSSVTGGNSSTGVVTLSGPAPGDGAVVSLSSSDTAVAGVPPSVTVPAGSTTGAFTVTTGAVAASTSVTISASYGTVSQTTSLTVTPPPATLSSLTLNPSSVTGGNSSTGTVTLNGPAPGDGAVVSLSSSNTAAGVPPTVTVPAGATSAAFTVTTSAVAASTSVTISASYGTVTQTASLTVTPPRATLSSLTLSPSSVTGGSPSTGNVALSGPAPSGGAVVSLSSDNTTVVRVPASITVPAGTTSATFSVSTSPVAASTSVTISASYNGVSRNFSLTVVPPTLTSLTLNPSSVTAGNSSTGTVTLSGLAASGGVVVALSSSNTSAATVPQSVTIPAGAARATFTVNTNLLVLFRTTVTISASYRGTTRTAVLTVSPLVPLPGIGGGTVGGTVGGLLGSL